jgi:hypothetical protein
MVSGVQLTAALDSPRSFADSAGSSAVTPYHEPYLSPA